jgi:hypothetical protein
MLGLEMYIDDWMEKEMDQVKRKALIKLSRYLVQDAQTSKFAEILSYSWWDSIPAAEKIADSLDLCKLDFLAIDENLEFFKDEYMKEQALNF